MPSFANALAHPALTCALLLVGSNVFMTYLWAGLCLMGAVYFIFRG